MGSRKRPFPPQIKYIVGNEACERFSYYGMRSILVVFMAHHLLMPQNEAQAIFHLFAGACYFLPLLGGYLSDRFLGKYRTIMSLSLLYCLGHGILALNESKLGLYCGLALIALGAGGVKPCVSAYVGDQFTGEEKNRVNDVFGLFYWSINLGAFFSTLTIPWILPHYGPSWAFGVPGILMALATFVFWLGRRRYVNVPPSQGTGEAGFLPILLYALRNRRNKRPGQNFWDTARARYSEKEVRGAEAAADVFKIFAAVSMFWALFEQQGSSWVLQAEKMNLNVLGVHFEPSQISALNSMLLLCLIPVFSLLVYPALEKLGVKMTPLRRMGAGMALCAIAFLCVGLIQVPIDRGRLISVAWQAIPYLIITMSEIMVSITGLEFAYTQAPRSMKSTIMSFWFLTIAAGDYFTAYIADINVFHGARFFFFFAALMAALSAVFILGAVRYRMKDFTEDEPVTSPL